MSPSRVLGWEKGESKPELPSDAGGFPASYDRHPSEIGSVPRQMPATHSSRSHDRPQLRRLLARAIWHKSHGSRAVVDRRDTNSCGLLRTHTDKHGGELCRPHVSVCAPYLSVYVRIRPYSSVLRQVGAAAPDKRPPVSAGAPYGSVPIRTDPYPLYGDDIAGLRPRPTHAYLRPAHTLNRSPVALRFLRFLRFLRLCRHSQRPAAKPHLCQAFCKKAVDQGAPDEATWFAMLSNYLSRSTETRSREAALVTA